MKSEHIERRLRRSLMLRFLVPLTAATFIYLGLIYLAFYVFKWTLSDVLLQLLGSSVYYGLMDTKWVWFAACYLLIFILLLYRTISRTVGYITPLADSVDRVFNKEAAPVSLPSELNDIENKLNSIKYAMLRSEQAVKEAEQRKNDLVVYLAHDLKTPLTSVIGYLTLLDEAPDMPPEQRARYTGVALDKAYRLEQLINEFFEITRFNLQSVALEAGTVHLSRMLYQVADEFYPLLAEKGLRIEPSIEEELTLVGDADKLARVFDNLLRNAVSYSYADSVIWLSARRDGETVCVTVRNAGDPIPKQQLERLFEKFFRLDNARQSHTGGAGLGLAIARQIVELHGGTITAESGPQGTMFAVRLPAGACS